MCEDYDSEGEFARLDILQGREKKRWLGVSPQRSDQPASKRCSKRCLVQFFIIGAGGQSSISKSTISA